MEKTAIQEALSVEDAIENNRKKELVRKRGKRYLNPYLP